MNEDDFTRDLPEGWALPTIGECVELKYGKGLPKRQRVKGNVHVYGSNGVVDFHNQAVTAGETIVIGRKGTVGVVHYSDSACWPIDTTYFIDEFYGLSPSYLTHTLRYADLARLESSTAIPGLNRDDIYVQCFPLAPAPEQDRIAAKVEELLNGVEKAKNHLERVPAILENFRKAVLDAACFGRLTEDWRERYPDLEPASKPLARTIERRTKEYEAACANAKAEGKKKPKKPTNLEQREVETSTLPTIPNSWTWAYLSELGELNRGRSRHRPRNAEHLYGGPYPFIQTGVIARSGGRITHHKQTYSETGLAQSRLWAAGTVCITIAANIANSAILTYPACFPDSVVGLITEQGLCDNRYIEFFIRTAREDLSHFAPATAQKNINIGILSNVAVPLPPYEEQIEIADRLERLLSLADKTVRRVGIAEENTEKITQSILAKAFTGELVPTEAELAKNEGREYETAQQLLERIQAEKEAKPKRKRRITKRVKIIEYISVTDEVNVELKMKSSLFKIISERGKNITPEDLLEASKYSIETIEDFYEELARLEKEGEIEDFRPNNIVSVIRVKK